MSSSDITKFETRMRLNVPQSDEIVRAFVSSDVLGDGITIHIPVGATMYMLHHLILTGQLDQIEFNTVRGEA